MVKTSFCVIKLGNYHGMLKMMKSFIAFSHGGKLKTVVINHRILTLVNVGSAVNN
jgi:hypothetical protein